MHASIRAVEKDLDAYKLEVAKYYATNNAISQVEERVVQAIERLGDRLDRFLENRPRSRS
jgi:outer membrane protein assembly factor BamD (BamD/ComL family)